MGRCLVYPDIKSIVCSLERKPVPLPTVYWALQITRLCMYRDFVYSILASTGTLTRVAGAATKCYLPLGLPIEVGIPSRT